MVIDTRRPPMEWRIMSKILTSLLITSLITTWGCAHAHLRHNTLLQTKEVSRIYEQQVLDNLAMFIVNPESVPNLALVGGSTHSIRDAGSATAMPPLNPFFTVLQLNGQRAADNAWASDPIRDPNKLHLLRCAFQSAVGYQDSVCTDRSEWQKRFVGQGYAPGGPCVPTPGWYCVGSKKQVISSNCDLTGEYCGTHVWVLPEGHAEFGRFMMHIMSIAFAETVVVTPPKKTVRLYVDRNGLPVLEGEAVGTVEAVIGLRDPISALWSDPQAKAALDREQSLQVHAAASIASEFGIAPEVLLGQLRSLQQSLLQTTEIERRDAIKEFALSTLREAATRKQPTMDELNDWLRITEQLWEIEQMLQAAEAAPIIEPTPLYVIPEPSTSTGALLQFEQRRQILTPQALPDIGR